MVMTWRKCLSVVAVPVALSLAACATGRGGVELSEEDIGDAIMIEVQNNSRPPGPVTIWVVGLGGTRRNLGSISADRTRTFNFNDTGLPREYQLMAVLEDRGEIRSRPFQMFAAARVRWWIESNDVRVTIGRN